MTHPIVGAKREGRMTRREWLQGAALVAGAVAGGAWTDRAAAALGAPLTAAAGPAAGRTPTGTLTVSLPARIVGLDPIGTQAAEDSVRTAAAHIFDSLVVRSPNSAKYLPSLATKWETPDPLTWVFTLRPGAKFHDGTPVTGGDVKASLQRLVDLKGPFTPLWTALDTVDTPSDTTVRIKTKTPLGTMLPNLSLLSVAPAAKMDQQGFFNKPIGSGPFRVVSYQPDSELVLEAYPGYWGPAPGVKTLRFKDIPEIAARVTALITGEIDLSYGLPPDQIASIRGQKDIRMVSEPSFRYHMIWMNCKRDPFTDKRVRQAMAYALDVDTMVKTLMPGIGRRMTAPIPSLAFGYAPQRPYAYDPTRAKQLLAAAGHPNGFDCTMIWNPDSAPQDRELAQALFSYWNAVGVRVHDGQAERSLWLDKLLRLDWDMDFQANGDTTGDADFVLRRLYTTQANRLGYSNPQLDQILNAAAATVDQVRRKVLYGEACEIVWDDAIGIYPVELIQTYVYRQGVEGFVATPSYPTFQSVTVRR
ncbi:MAG TPA: ABC transporter substrate-binding protein [bacterium]|nr:ABC transporter substrate-binding protein [bacterium]